MVERGGNGTIYWLINFIVCSPCCIYQLRMLLLILGRPKKLTEQLVLIDFGWAFWMSSPISQTSKTWRTFWSMCMSQRNEVGRWLPGKLCCWLNFEWKPILFPIKSKQECNAIDSFKFDFWYHEENFKSPDSLDCLCMSWINFQHFCCKLARYYTSNSNIQAVR